MNCKNDRTSIPVILVLLILLIAPDMQAQNARIKIDVDRTIGQVDKMIYGNFVEHLVTVAAHSSRPNRGGAPWIVDRSAWASRPTLAASAG